MKVFMNSKNGVENYVNVSKFQTMVAFLFKTIQPSIAIQPYLKMKTTIATDDLIFD